MGRRKTKAGILTVDPFDVSEHPTPAQIAWAEWFKNIVTKLQIQGKYHIRRIHYKIIGMPKPDGTPYQNTPADWTGIIRASDYARYIGLVDFDQIEDHKNEGVIVQTIYEPDKVYTDLRIFSRSFTIGKITDLRDIIADNAFLSNVLKYDVQSRQPYHIEIWVEKSTLNDILIPLAKKVGATLVLASGQFSLTNVKDFFKRIENASKPVRLFYLRDFDPAGETMPTAVARKIEWFVRKHKPDLDVKLLDVALTHNHCIKFNLPREPMKRSDVYKGNFEERYGEGATELDALEALYPGKLEEILLEAVKPYFDEKLVEEIFQFQSEEHERFEVYGERVIEQILKANENKLLPLVEQFNIAIEQANKIGREIEGIFENIEVDSDFEAQYPAKNNHVVDDTNIEFLLDTTRTYEKQLRRYNGRTKAISTAAEVA